MRTRKDVVLGRIMVERGLLTEDRLKDCFRAQQVFPSDPNQTLGTSQTRPLLAVLMELGVVKEHEVAELLDEQNRRLAVMDDYDKMARTEMVFGQLVVKHNKATQLQVNKCVEIQRRLAEQGKPVPRLGELMVEHGFLDAPTVQEILQMQHKDVLFCSNCGKQFNVIGIEPGRIYHCRLCGGPMVPKANLDKLNAEETTFGFELPSGDSPSSPRPPSP